VENIEVHRKKLKPSFSISSYVNAAGHLSSKECT
jgi:hypothetical protein